MLESDYGFFAELDYGAARDFFIQANKDISENSKEDPLRYLFCTRLPTMFPDRPWWIDEHARKAEANENYNINNAGKSGFVDVLIGCTTVEYEKNLAKQSIFNQGYEQVKDYCAGLLNKGMDQKNIVGVLSDTVRWHAYRISIDCSECPAADNGLWGRDDFDLEEIECLDMTDVSDENLRRFELFINRYYGRIAFKKLTPEALVSDFGLDCGKTKSRTDAIRKLVANACNSNSGYAKLIKSLWTDFVESTTGTGSGFVDDYAHELYIITLAKLIAANILESTAPERDVAQVRDVLDGSFFVSMGIDNLVEYDYFGWLNSAPYVDDLVKYAIEVQRDLMVYDFANVVTSDLFGGLISQMASADKRILLGQAPTPQAIAAKMVARVLENLNGQTPRLVDMCCGSGVFVVETLSQLIDSVEDSEHITQEDLALLAESIYGFDVDPLAVLLSKVNWILAMRPYIHLFERSVHIPIYHADSLFTRTPVSMNDSSKGSELEVRLYDRTVVIPQFLIERSHRQLFDEMVMDADIIAASCADDGSSMDGEYVSHVFLEVVTKSSVGLDEEAMIAATKTFIELVRIFSDLRSRDRNGIWPFILGNSFKPAFAAGLFNGVVSNPPWLALSRLRENPYRDALVKLANAYGIMPRGSAFLHVELAAIFLVGSIQRYVAENGVIACVMPHSMLNGRHEESFRAGGYLTSPIPTSFKLTEIWELPQNAFNNRAVVLFAAKEPGACVESEVQGAVFDADLQESSVTYNLITNGRATAYSYKAQRIEEALDPIAFHQGFDGMPRTAVVFKCEKQPNDLWSVSSIPKNGDPLSFVVKDAKKCKDFSVGRVSNIDESLLFDIITSNQVMPFAPVLPLKAFLPIKYVPGQDVVELTDCELSLLGRSNKLLADKIKHCTENGTEFYAEKKGGYLAYIDMRRKLSHTLQDTSPWRVLYGAGGTNLSATSVKCDEVSRPHKLAIDQTVYWRPAKTEEEALYYVGLLNSDAINDAIKEFQSEGNQGKRHIHTLPLSLINEFNPEDEKHLKIAKATKDLQERLKKDCESDAYLAELLDPSRGTLSRRRKAFQQHYKAVPEFSKLNDACLEAI